ncbi:hypothetical protein TELCIR_03013, partial [Teladorsagia circumcincta]
MDSGKGSNWGDYYYRSKRPSGRKAWLLETIHFINQSLPTFDELFDEAVRCIVEMKRFRDRALTIPFCMGKDCDSITPELLLPTETGLLLGREEDELCAAKGSQKGEHMISVATLASNHLLKVLGGYLASRFGGKRVILATILGSSLLTLASPVAARTHAYILAGLRVAIGFLQGATFPAMHTMWSVWGPPLELSVLTGVSYAGVIGVIWCAVWTYVITDRPSDHPLISEAEKEYITKAVEASTGKRTGKLGMVSAVPYIAYFVVINIGGFLADFIRSREILGTLNTRRAAMLIAYFVVINIGGFLADFIRSREILGTLNTRRAAMLIALLGQAMFLVLSGYCGCGQE